MADDNIIKKLSVSTPIAEQIALCIIEQEEALEQIRYHEAEVRKQQRRADGFGEIIATLQRREEAQ